MNRIACLIFFCFLLSVAVVPSALAEDTAALFINLTTDEPHRARMGIGFGKSQLERGHPLTLYLNDRAVLLGSMKNAEAFKQHHRMLATLMENGAQVLICPGCMKHYGVDKTDLLPGLKISSPTAAGTALFGENTRTLSW